MSIGTQDGAPASSVSSSTAFITAADADFSLNTLSPASAFTRDQLGTPTRSVDVATYYGTWPLAYKLPIFPPTLQAASAKRNDLSFIPDNRNACRTHLVQVLFEDIMKYNWYVYILNVFYGRIDNFYHFMATQLGLHKVFCTGIIRSNTTTI